MLVGIMDGIGHSDDVMSGMRKMLFGNGGKVILDMKWK